MGKILLLTLAMIISAPNPAIAAQIKSVESSETREYGSIYYYWSGIIIATLLVGAVFLLTVDEAKETPVSP